MVDECVEHDDPAACGGEVDLYPALSGSGLSYPRCERGYGQYEQRVRPRIDAIRERYPDSATPPGWFDPAAAGERWNPDDP